MDDTKRLREIAASIITDSNDEVRIKNAAELLKLASEIENQRAGASKLESEEQKIRFDLGESRGHRKTDDRKTYITLLAPVVTTFVLAGTLILQSYQFAQSEKDKKAELKQQADAAEDVRWTDAVKLLSQSNNLSPAGALLKSFIRSERYGAQAHQTALQILLKTDEEELFENLFGSVFEPVGWSDFPQLVDLNRALHSNFLPVVGKTWDPQKQVNDLSRLNEQDRKQYDSFTREIEFTSARIASVLRVPRPKGAAIDLHSTDLLVCDLQGADLSGANLDLANISNANLRGANLRGITHAQFTIFSTAWWEASEISQDVLQYLMITAPFQPGHVYGLLSQAISQKDYDENIARLQKTASGQ
jgi:hypothetical protein